MTKKKYNIHDPKKEKVTFTISKFALDMLSKNTGDRKHSSTIERLIIKEFQDKDYVKKYMIKELERLREYGNPYNLQLNYQFTKEGVEINFIEKKGRHLAGDSESDKLVEVEEPKKKEKIEGGDNENTY